MLARRVDYLFQANDDFVSTVTDQASLIRYAVKYAKAIVVYDVIKLDEEDDDQTLVRFINVKIANADVEIDFDEDSDEISSNDAFEEIKRYPGSPEEATIEKLWEDTIIPTLCEEFTTEEINSFIYVSIELS